MIKTKIRTKLLVLFLLVGLVPVITIGYLNIRTMKAELHREISDGLLSLAEAKEGQVYAYLGAIESRTIDFASDGFIRDSLKKINNGDDINQTVNVLNTHLIVNKKSLDKTLLGIMIIDLNGIVIASTDDDEIGKNKSKDIYFIEGKKGVFLIEFKPHKHFGLINSFVVTAPLTDKKTEKVLGVIVNIFDSRKMAAILSGQFQLEKRALSAKKSRKKTLEIYMVNKEKMMFVHPVQMEYKKGIHFPGMKTDTLPVQKCLENMVETIDIYTNYAGKEVIGASMCIPDMEWTLLSEISTEEVFLPVNEAIFRMALIIAFFAFMMVLIALIFSATIAKPITKLRNTAVKIGKGNLDVKIDIKSKDEIGDLASSFNQMTKDLRLSQKKICEYSKNLEKLVAERTMELKKSKKELESKINELEKFQRLSVGRELKMVELKNKIKQLQKKLMKKD